MSESEQGNEFKHLFTDTVRETMGGSVYGSWRAVSDPDAVPFSFGYPYPDSFPNEDLLSAAEALFNDEGDCALQYSGGDYSDALTDAIIDQAGNRGITCDENEVHLTNGATHAIDTVCQTFLDSGDVVLVEEPTFMGALRLFRNYNAEIEGIDMDNNGLDIDSLAAELEVRDREGRTLPKLVYTIPNFQNPTGVTLPQHRRERLLDLAETYDFLILEDDPYGELRYYGEEPLPIKALDETGRTIRVNTFSKTIAPGVRTGWILAHENIVEQLTRINAGGTNTFTQGVIGRYWQAGYLEENIVELRKGYKQRRDHMLRCLTEHMPPGTGWSEPDGGFFIWVEFPEGTDSEAILSDAIDEGVAYLPGSFFYPNEGGRRHARLSFSHASIDEIEQGVKTLGTTLRSEVTCIQASDD